MYALLLLAVGGCGEAGPQGDPGTNATPAAPVVHPAPEAGQGVPEFPSAEAHRDAELSYRIIDAPNGTFGYEVTSGERLLIHQPNLPGQPGVEGCRSPEDAEKLARLVMGKIARGEMPPTVSSAELRELGILPASTP